MRIFVTGSEGQLGTVLRASLAEAGHEVAGGDLPGWDMMDGRQVEVGLRAFAPDVVLHAAALTNVDYCAEHPQEAVRINGVGTYNVALACREIGAQIVAISSNEVFDGTADRPYEEYDPRRPINPYGRSKAVAEQVVERFAPDYMIVRTAWLYAPGGTNFIHKILERARSGGPLRVVTDEVGSPTYAVDLADGLTRLIALGRPGIYHLANAGACSRHEFAEAIVELAGLDTPVEPITSDAFDRPSTPPPYSPLANVFAAALGVTMRPWREALAAYLAEHES
jgi:dTDP-4-dehydrorhamnose reductase